MDDGLFHVHLAGDSATHPLALLEPRLAALSRLAGASRHGPAERVQVPFLG